MRGFESLRAYQTQMTGPLTSGPVLCVLTHPSFFAPVYSTDRGIQTANVPPGTLASVMVWYDPGT